MTTALYEAGYGSSSRLYERAPSHLGMTPAAYGRGGAGMQIHYAIVDSPLGRLLVGATDRGVSAIYLGESDATLRAALRKEYPAAGLIASLRPAGRKIGGSLGERVGKILPISAGRSRTSIFPRTCRARRFSGAFGRNCARFPTVRRRRTRRSPARSAGRLRFAPWLELAPLIPSPWSFRAIAWCGRTGIWRAIGGESAGSGRYLIGKRMRRGNRRRGADPKRR